MPIGSVELRLPVGGDFSQDNTGDLVLDIDAYSNPAATIARQYRLILSNPRLFDAENNPISVSDDPFYPNYGSGARAEVGEMQGQALTAAIGARIAAAEAVEPDIAPIPAPIISVTQIDYNTIEVDISVVSVTGEIITVPPLAITVGG